MATRWERIPRGGGSRYPVARYDVRGAERSPRLELSDAGSVSSPYRCLSGSSQGAALVAQCLREAQEAGREEFWVVFLDPSPSGYEPAGVARLAVGGEDSVVVPLPLLLRLVLLSGRDSFLVAHNHPGGDPRPSTSDWTMTSGLIEAAELLELEIVDHLIVGDGCYASLCEMAPTMFDAEHRGEP